MKNVGVFVDVGNLHHNISKKYGSEKLDYKRFLEIAIAQNNLYKALAYGIYLKDDDTSFMDCLKYFGYETNFKKPPMKEGKIVGWINWNVTITLDILKVLPKLDIVVIGTSNREIIPTLEWIKSNGLQTVVISALINSEIKAACNTWIEIDKGLLLNVNPVDQATE